MGKSMIGGSKGNSTRRAQDGHPSVTHRHITRAKKKGVWEAKYFYMGFPLAFQDRIEGIEARKWEKLDEMTLNSKTKVIKEWVMNPRNIVSQVGLYERIVSLFQVTNNLMGHVLWEHIQQEEGDDTLVQ